MAEPMLFDIPGAVNRGYAIGTQQRLQREGEQRQSRLRELAGQAAQASPLDRQQFVSQAIGVDPQAGMQLDQGLAQTDERRNRTMVNMARMLSSAPEQARPGLYQRMLPTLQTFGMSDLPPAYTPETAPVIDQAAQALAQAYGASGSRRGNVSVSPGSAIVDPNTGQVVYERPYTPSFQARTTDIGGVPTGVTFDTRSGQYVPAEVGGGAPGGQLPPGGAQQRVDESLQLANEMIRAGVPEEQVDQFLRNRFQSGPGAAPVVQPSGTPIIGRTAEDEAAAVESAREAARLQALPTRQAIETQGAVGRLRAEQEAERMPPAVMKMVQESEEKARTADGILRRMEGHEAKIRSGDLQFGPVSNVVSRARNFAGQSTDLSRNLQLFMSDLEKMRNDSLRLNNGVQTEGDAQRAWNELFANLNDTNYVLAGLQRIKEINERASALHSGNANEIRESYPQGRSPRQSGSQPQQPAQQPSAPSSDIDSLLDLYR